MHIQVRRFYQLLSISLLITLILWLISKDDFAEVTRDIPRSITQLAALFGAVSLFLEPILSSRFGWIRKWIAPQDILYKAHRTLGVITILGVIIHVATLLIRSTLNGIDPVRYLIPGFSLAYSAGIISFYLLLTLIVTTLYLKLSYKRWKVVHRITSITVLFSTIHILTIPSDVSGDILLRGWILLIIGISLISWFYKQFIYDRTAYKYQYIVESIQRSDTINMIRMKARGKSLESRPGQYAFFRFKSSSGNISAESHPFSIIDSNSNNLTIAVKSLGDFTNSLRGLKEGDEVRVTDAYGKFGDRYFNNFTPAVWVAGGIGITPFMSLLHELHRNGEQRETYFYHSVRSEDETLFDEETISIASKFSNFKFTKHVTADQGYLEPKNVTDQISDPTNADYFICGPKGLLNSFTDHLKNIGVSSDRIIYEEFDFKTL